MKSFLAVVLCTACSCSLNAVAGVIFQDDFEADVPIDNQTTFVGGWMVAFGTVDVAKDYVLPGTAVDLDGSTFNAGVFWKSLVFDAGVAYTATFDLAGGQRGMTEVVDVAFGSAAATYTLGANEPYSQRTLSFTPAVGGIYSLAFSNRGGDNLGAWLDNVSISAEMPVPEPGGLLLGGLLLSAATLTRRR